MDQVSGRGRTRVLQRECVSTLLDESACSLVLCSCAVFVLAAAAGGLALHLHLLGDCKQPDPTITPRGYPIHEIRVIALLWSGQARATSHLRQGLVVDAPFSLFSLGPPQTCFSTLRRQKPLLVRSRRVVYMSPRENMLQTCRT